MDEQSEQRLELKRQFSDFLDQDHGLGEYLDKIKALLTKENLSRNRLRLDVDIHDLQKFNSGLYRSLLSDPESCIQPFEDALDDLIRNAYPKLLQDTQVVKIGFVGEFGANRISPRQLTSRLISALVNIEGIVTRCSLVRPKIVKSVHYVEATGSFISKIHRDGTSLDGATTAGGPYPTRDDAGHTLSTEFGLCQYRDHQVISVQELPETSPPGQLPRGADIILEDDLVDSCKPGDRISLVGVYKAIPPRAQGNVSGTFRSMLLANSVKQLGRDTNASKITLTDIKNIEKLAAEPDALDQLANSLAPSIYGHKVIKRGLLMLLLGGRERNLENNTHLRGDINCLLVGDPGVAKSQMLRAIMNVAPLAVSTTGRGSSGVGLTAAVTHDKDTGERRLEAGAMVLADRGIVCIDEFDKMNDLDRVAIHEVMEQQTVTIAKAGIQMSLNARCSVLAAANPLYGSYDHTISITRNINLPDSLLSRFDLLFVVLDNLSAAQDREIATHVLGQHRYRAVGEDGRSVVSDAQARLAEEDEDERETQEQEGGDMYVKYNRVLHGPLGDGRKPPLSINFLRKFLIIAKRRGSDLSMTEQSMEAIADFYTELRGASQENALPITVRTLETIIRLSTATAKARLAEAVEPQDVGVAKALMRSMMTGSLEGNELLEDEVDDFQEPQIAQKPEAQQQTHSSRHALLDTSKHQRGKRARDADEPELSDVSNDENDPAVANQAVSTRQQRRKKDHPSDGADLTEADLAVVKEVIQGMLQIRGWTGSATVSALQARVAQAGHAFNEAQLVQALELITKEQGEKTDALPVFYNAEDAKFYEL